MSDMKTLQFNVLLSFREGKIETNVSRDPGIRLDFPGFVDPLLDYLDKIHIRHEPDASRQDRFYLRETKDLTINGPYSHFAAIYRNPFHRGHNLTIWVFCLADSFLQECLKLVFDSLMHIYMANWALTRTP